MSSVAVCVPCWNQVGYTRWFVESVKRNTGGEHHIQFIFLDNGSTDETYKYLRSMRRVTLLRNEQNRGVNPAWNQLLREALEEKRHGKLDVICLANNDIVVGPRWLDGICEALGDPQNKSYLHANGTLSNHENFDNDVHTMLPRVQGQRMPGRAGWCLFFTPEMVRTFLPIPHELTLWFGDDWIHYKLEQAGYKCEVQLDCFALHFLSKSIEEHPEKIALVEKDREIFRRLIGEEAFAKLYR